MKNQPCSVSFSGGSWWLSSLPLMFSSVHNTRCSVSFPLSYIAFRSHLGSVCYLETRVQTFIILVPMKFISSIDGVYFFGLKGFDQLRSFCLQYAKMAKLIASLRLITASRLAKIEPSRPLPKPPEDNQECHCVSENCSSNNFKQCGSGRFEKLD